MSRSGPSSVFVQAWLSDSHPRMFTAGPVADVAGRARPWHHDHLRPARPRSVGCGSELPEQVGGSARAGGRAACGRCKVRSRPPIPPGSGLDMSTTPSRPRRSGGQVRVPRFRGRGPDSSFSPPRGATVLAALQARTWSQRGENAESHHSGSSRQQQTCRRSTAWPRAGLRGQRLPRHRRPTRAPSGKSAGKAGATVRDAGRTSDQDGPEPGQLRRRRARSNRRPEERSDGERTGPERRHGRGGPRGALCRMAEGELGPLCEDVLRAARRGVSTSTN